MTIQPIFFAVQDGRLYRWQQKRPGLTTQSREAFPSLDMAQDAALVVAACYCGLYRCPSCQQEYDPTFGKACPYCATRQATALFTGDPAVAQWAGEGAPTCGATWTGDYSDVDSDANRDDYIGE